MIELFKEKDLDDKLSQKKDVIVRDAQTIIIKNDEQLHRAADLLKSIKSLQKQINKCFDPSIKAAHDAHKEILEAKKRQSEPLKKAEKIIKPKIAQYQDEQEHIRREAERKLQEELRKKEEEKLLKEAIGNEAVLDEPVVVPVVKMEDTTKHEGISRVTEWHWRLKDFSIVPEEYKMLDEVKLNRVVRAMENNISIPGIEIYSEKKIRSKAW